MTSIYYSWRFKIKSFQNPLKAKSTVGSYQEQVSLHQCASETVLKDWCASGYDTSMCIDQVFVKVACKETMVGIHANITDNAMLEVSLWMRDGWGSLAGTHTTFHLSHWLFKHYWLVLITQTGQITNPTHLLLRHIL